MLIVLIAMSLGLMSQNYVDVAMVEDMKREADEKSVVLYAKLSYTRPENMSNVDVAFYDIRTNIDVNVVPFMKRYYDACYSAHPSVLVNNLAPKYFVFFVDDIDSQRRLVTMLSDLKSVNKTCSVVMLYAGHDDIDRQIVRWFDAIYMLRSDNDWAFDLLTQAFWGGIEVTLSKDNPPYLDTLPLRAFAKCRLAYSLPSSVGMNREILDSVDIVMEKMISEGASPGGVLLVARNGRVVLERSYGHTTYKSRQNVTHNHLYDIASLSKIVGTLPLVMKYNTLGVISLNDPLKAYIKVPKDKSDIKIEDLLLHHSGLSSGVPAFMLCVDSASIVGRLYSRYRRGHNTIQIEPRLYMLNNLLFRPNIFSNAKSEKYSVEVSQQMFTTDSFRIRIFDYIDNSKLLSPKYRYSDLNFIYLQRVLESTSGATLDNMFRSMIAEPLGICRMCYRPMEYYRQQEIVPTENDRYFRKSQVWGTVHDQTCALLGGVAGHAGLFATAGELAKIGQLYLNGGTYGGVRLFSSQVTNDYTQRHRDDSRRGYGFDKPEFREGLKSPVAQCVPLSSYGHTGFTGTLMWIDPENQLVYIFLSNRISPDAYNTKLTTLNIRSDIHSIIYRAMGK